MFPILLLFITSVIYLHRSAQKFITSLAIIDLHDHSLTNIGTILITSPPTSIIE